ncbi:2-isopropylmalate synthase [Legionella fallonii]|uniref:Branched-chain-amino-acid aminotransferase n=1 Tax=Legionella fallonii LLAP-10 TaxID=1212491 RepID=A0A098G599_9GAMM|nr:2-isopropylmalate synthase [Legionella fallonii]CEG57156.1 putative 2-isopropylmalate synthase [Legionella fallonii LLAP-10]
MKQNTTDQIIILDTTLRDGEQAPGATMMINEKIEIAQSLDYMGIDVIEAGFAAASQGDFQCIKSISKEVKNAVVSSLARAKPVDIEAAGAAINLAARPRIHTFISTSDMHLKHQFRMTQEDALQAIRASVALARNYCDDIEWSAMDATRTPLDFLARAIEIAINAGATTINIPDTVGYTTPYEYAFLIKAVKQKVPNIDKAIISVHCHNDLGLAVANSLSAINAGARQVECTINGIGERAGNAALEEIVMAIKTRPEQFPYTVNVNPQYIAEISSKVSIASGFIVQKNKAIVGANAFAHESGIHQDGMLKCRDTYEIITPESVGFHSTKLSMGKHSGRAAFRNKLISLKIDITEESFDELFTNFKQLGDIQKEITDKDIIALVQGKTSPIQINSIKENSVIWMDGQFISWSKAQVPVLTHALHYASAVFEGERAYQGKVFKLDEHNQRLHHSAQQLGFTIPYSVDELNAITAELVFRNNLQDAYIRPIAWCGEETMSVASHSCKVHVAIVAWQWRSYFSDDQIMKKGLKLMWADWIRPSPATAPVSAKAAGLYMIGSLSKNKAEQSGFHDALMLDYRGYIAECTGANFFMVKDGVIHTPIADCFLKGITRQTIIALAREHHIPVIERHIQPNEVNNADEVFITGSAVEVAPVSQIGTHFFKVGAITQIIIEAYNRLVREPEEVSC